MTSTLSQKPLTFVYKTVANRDGAKEVEIALDVYLPTHQHGKAPKPLIWIHTGGFLQGSRTFLPHVRII